MSHTTFQSIIELKEMVIATFDIDHFTALTKNLDPVAVFSMINEIVTETEFQLEKSGGRLIKMIGDSALITFPPEKIDQAVVLLFDLKSKLEEIAGRGRNKQSLSFSIHFGEVATGTMGKSGFFDIMGDAVNTAFRLIYGDQKRGRFAVSPQVFRKLKPETRKYFHKFTPPIVYFGELN